MRSATYMELAVITSSPAIPITMPRTVSCLFSISRTSIGILLDFSLLCYGAEKWNMQIYGAFVNKYVR